MRTNKWAPPLRMLPLAALLLAVTPTLLHAAPTGFNLLFKSISFLIYLASHPIHGSRPGKSVGNGLFCHISYLGR